MTRIMRNISISILCLILVSNANSVWGNNVMSDILLLPKDSVLNRITNIDERVKQYTVKDTLGGFSTPRKVEAATYFNFATSANQPIRDREGLIVVPLNYEPFLSYMNFVDTVIVSPEMLPIVFEGKILPHKLCFTSPINRNPITATLIDRDSIVSADLYQYKTAQKKSYKLIDKDSTLVDRLWKVNRAESIRKEYYTSYPQRVKLNALAFNSSPIIKSEVENKSPFKELISAGDAVEIARPDISKYQVKQVYWKKKGEHKLEVSQKAYSKNWNPNTNDNFQVQNYHKFSAEYRKDKVEFTHWIEWRFNSQYIKLPNDPNLKEGDEDMRSAFLINDDWIRTYNKLGLDAFIKKWSYIITLDLKTPVFNKYPQNNKKKRQAGLFSPLEGNFGIGTGYTYERKSKTTRGREFKLSIDTKPFSVDIKHVGSNKVYYYTNDKGERVLNNTHGVVYEKGHKKEGQRRYTKTELGFTLNTTLDYKYNSYTSIYTRMKFFGNYKDRTYAELENTIKFQLNRYLATSLYVYMKFDDNQKDPRMHGAWKYFAFNEVLGFGLSYNW